MALPQIDKMKIKHEAILDYMLANPTCTYAEVSTAFGVTVPWISCIVNSDIFQEKLRGRRDEMFEAGVLAPLEGRMKAVAELTLDRLAEKVQVAESVPDLTNTADKILGRLGYGSTANGNTGGNQNNFIFGPALIQRAQSLIGRNSVGDAEHTSPRQIEGGEGYQAPALQHAEVPARSESSRDALRAQSAPLDGTEV
jgi:hypothetical protein